MRRSLQAAVVLFVLMITAVAFADEQVCGPKSDFKLCIALQYQKICTSPANGCSDDWRVQWMTLQSYCATNGGSDVCTAFGAHPASRLLFHHGARNSKWEAVGIAQRTKFDLNHIPTVSVGGQDHLIVAVDQTNPLLYTLEIDAATKDKIDQFAQLQTLVGLLGGNLAQLVKARAEKLTSLSGDSAKELDALTGKVLDSAVNVNCLLMATDARAREITRFIQSVESGGDEEYPISVQLTCSKIPFTTTGAVQALADLDTPLARLSCSGPADLDAALSTDPSKFKDIQRAIVNIETAATFCPFWTEAPPSGKATRLELLERDLTDVMSATDDKTMATALQGVVELATAAHRAAAVLSKTPDFSKLAALPKSIAALEDFDRAVRRVTFGNSKSCTADPRRQCIKPGNVFNFIVVDGVNGDDVSWQDLETQPIKIAVGGDFASNIHPLRQTAVSTSYKIQPASARAWDVGVGLVRTRVFDPKFTAVTDPTDPSGKAKLIAQTGETTRSGELALFANLRPVAFFRPDAPSWTRALGIEIGSAVSTDKPAVFGGLSVQLGRYFRLGWGYNAERVTELKGQTIGTPVTSNDDIRTRQAFHNGHYLSLTVSLGSIPLFPAPKN